MARMKKLLELGMITYAIPACHLDLSPVYGTVEPKAGGMGQKASDSKQSPSWSLKT